MSKRVIQCKRDINWRLFYKDLDRIKKGSGGSNVDALNYRKGNLVDINQKKSEVLAEKYEEAFVGDNGCRYNQVPE